MEKSGFNSKRIFKDGNQELQDIVSLTIWNYGASDLTLTVNGQMWHLPKMETAKTTPSHFDITPDFTYSDYSFEFLFEGGSGIAVLAYKKLTKC